MDRNTPVKLEWKEFEQCSGQAFRDLFQDSDMTDVTLACADEIQIKAHKFVLCASSSFFRSILSKNSHLHPFLYLKGINSKTMKSLLTFIYLGHTEVFEDDITEFLDTAEELKIKGLCNINRDFPRSNSSDVGLPLNYGSPIIKPEIPSYIQDIVDYSDQENMAFNLNVINCSKCSFKPDSMD